MVEVYANTSRSHFVVRLISENEDFCFIVFIYTYVIFIDNRIRKFSSLIYLKTKFYIWILTRSVSSKVRVSFDFWNSTFLIYRTRLK